MALQNNKFQKLLRFLGYFLLGIPFWSFILFYVIVSLPVFAYRWIVTSVLAPLRGGNLGKAVTTTSHNLIRDFLEPKNPPRCNLVVRMVVKGNISFDDFCSIIRTHWLEVKDKNGNLKYPEFQQYMETWMGFMFWKHNENFDLKNHTYLHKVKQSATESEAESFLCQLQEGLIDKPNPSKASPWEMHLVQNYKNSELLSQRGYEANQELYVILLKIHHSMADGYSLLHLSEIFFGHNSPKIPIPVIANRSNLFQNVFSALVYPWILIEGGGRFAKLLSLPKSPYHIPDEKKDWRTMYERAPLVPLSKLKKIKNTFGVNFASVVNSVTAAALSKTWSKLDSCGRVAKSMMYANALPAFFHADKLRNRVFGVIFNIPTGNLDPLTRLQLCEKNLHQAKFSPMVKVSGMFLKLFGGNLACVVKTVSKNRDMGSAVSNFPGPPVEIKDRVGNPVLGLDFGAGLLNGVGGLGFMVLSYANYVQICATADTGVMSRQQLKELLMDVHMEIDLLYNLAVSTSVGDVTRTAEEIV